MNTRRQNNRWTKFLGWTIALALAQAALADPPLPRCRNHRTRAQWLDLLNEYSNGFGFEGRPSDFTFNRSLDRSWEFRQQVRSCSVDLITLGLWSCFNRSLQFAETLARLDSRFDRGGMGFQVPTDQYLSSQPAEIQTLPPQFNSAEIRETEGALRAQGYQVVHFQSALSEAERIVFFLQGNRSNGGFDRYYLYDAAVPTHVAVIFIEQNPADPENRRTHFREFNRLNPSETHHTNRSAGSCFQCHPQGLRQIVPIPPTPGAAPVRTSVTELRTINRQIRRTGIPDWNRQIDTAHFGPYLGSQERFGCTECHNGRDRSPIQWVTHYREIYRKVVEEGSMPPGLHDRMNLEHRLSYFNELYFQAQQDLRNWLSAEPCRSTGESDLARVPTLAPAPHCPP